MSRVERRFVTPSELLWLAAAPVLLACLVLAQPLAPNDLWYHVRAGEFLVREGGVPRVNGMSLGVPLETPYFYQSWLAELILYGTLQVGGLSGLQVLRALCFAGGLAFVVAATFRLLRFSLPIPPQRAAQAVSASAFVTALLASNNLDLRPQSFSALLFGFFLWALVAWEERPVLRRALTVLLIVIVWANTHGAFVVAPGLLAALTLGTVVERGPRGERITNFRRRALLFGASAVVPVVNPHGLGLFSYLVNLSTDTISQAYIQEWQSPRLDEPLGMLFIGVALFSLVLGWRGGWKLAAWWPSVALLFVMGARDQRAILWFGMGLPLVLAPAMAAFIARFRQSDSEADEQNSSVSSWPRRLALGALFAAPLLLLPPVKPLWPWPDSYRRSFAPTPLSLFENTPLLLERQTPVEAAEWLRKNPPRGRVFTDMVSGSYLTWATHPQIKPWCDPRIELFPVAFWQDYLRLSAGPADAADELQRRGFSDALLDLTTQRPLVKRLRADSRWREEIRRGPTVLFRSLK